MALIKRNNLYTFVKRVPTWAKPVDLRINVFVALKTGDLKRAELIAAKAEETLSAYWNALLAGRKTDAEKQYDALKTLAHARGYAYQTAQDLAAGPIAEIVKRLEDLEQSGDLQDSAKTGALLGAADRPQIPLSTLFDRYHEIKKTDLTGKTSDQLQRWKNPRKKAVRNLISVIGDKAIQDITRDDALQFREYWQERIEGENLSTNSANKDFTYLAAMLSLVNDMKRLGMVKNFSGLRFAEKAMPRLPFSNTWIRDRLLKPGAFDNMNDQARDIFFTMINTGCRPSEIAGLKPNEINLDHEIPHLALSDEHRELKTANAVRSIPLVGVSLEAMRRHPKGFDKYRDVTTNFSNTVNKFMRENGLMESDNHSAYSMRHSFEDRLTDIEAGERLKADLMGHKIERERYGQGPNLEQKLKYLELIDGKLVAR